MAAWSTGKDGAMRKSKKDLDDDLMHACEMGDPALISDLIERGAEAKENVWGDTPMSMAAKSGFVEAIRALAALGADPSASNRLGWTSIMAATSENQGEALRELVSLGGDIDARESFASSPGSRCGPQYEGDHAIFGSAEDESVHMGLLAEPKLRAKRDGDTALMRACASRGGVDDIPVKVVNLLIELGADVNLGNRHGVTPLMLAAGAANLEAMELLLSARARLDERDVNGCTALLRSMQEDATASSLMLLAAGADPRIPNVGGFACADWADWTGDHELGEAIAGACARCEANDLGLSLGSGKCSAAGRPRV
jgi:ankyrin repeat protein